MPQTRSQAESVLVLAARSAADLMSPNPLSLRADATTADAVALLVDKGLTAAPVVDESNHPIGVVSRTDLLVHERHKGDAAEAVNGRATLPVREVMTPAVFAVGGTSSAQKAVEEMVALRIQQLFVVDAQGNLIGSISALDVLRHLKPHEC